MPPTSVTSTSTGRDIDQPIRGTALLQHYQAVRQATLDLCQPLGPEDFVVQSMPDASPVKWHLAHTAWFFETFVLAAHKPDYQRFNELFGYLFNSYYNAIGDRLERPNRGLLTRPTVEEVFAYRNHVDRQMVDWLGGAEPTGGLGPTIEAIIEVGLHHEQQHQELILTDLKHAFGRNPIRPAYRTRPTHEQAAESSVSEPEPIYRVAFPEGVRWVGHGGAGFAYDNERPRHRQFLEAFRVASRPVTNAEYQAFINDGGYQRPELWLADGWAVRQSEGWSAPMHWEFREGQWWNFTLDGLRPVHPAEPVCHVSYYEADAYARWAGARLPTEAEWETAADVAITGNFLESGRLHPSTAPRSKVNEPLQMFGDVWEWTASAYGPYPGYRPPEGAIGEYNGKFMANQMVLRGGSCATPQSHIRPTYRNFFYPDARWQFTGFRLAQGA